MESSTSANVIVNPVASGGFKLFCRVTRRCSGGVTQTRVAYYNNEYGGSCGDGATGFSGSCGDPGLE